MPCAWVIQATENSSESHARPAASRRPSETRFARAKLEPGPGGAAHAAELAQGNLRCPDRRDDDQAAAARLPKRTRFSRCFSLRGGSLNSRAAVPPRILCLAFSERKGRS